MTECADTQAQLNDFADGTLPAPAQAMVQQHLDSCAACAAVLADLERIAEAAASLGPMTPPAGVWAGVAARLDAARHATTTERRITARPNRLRWLAVAATAVLVSGSVTWRLRTPPPAPTNPASASLESLNRELALALAHYERAVAELEAVTRTGRSQMDPATTTVVRANLLVIDRAIAESRAALVRHPENNAAMASLFEALERKISVLQAEIRIINDEPLPESGSTRPITPSGRES